MTTSTKDDSVVRVERLGGALGAMIHNLDLSRPLSDEMRQLIVDALRDYQVLCFGSQAITVEQQIDFSKQFGELAVDDRVLVLDRYMEGFPGVLLAGGQSVDVQRWHTDESYAPRPLSLAIMSTKEFSDVGDDLMFSDQHAAYDLLSDGMKRLLAPLRAINRVEFKGGEVEESVHPIVRTHPETGRKCLFVNSQYTKRIDGMTEAESQPLLSFLYQHCSQPFLTYLHSWKPGDFLMWDNVNTQHFVVSYPTKGSGRWWYRTSVTGSVPA